MMDNYSVRSFGPLRNRMLCLFFWGLVCFLFLQWPLKWAATSRWSKSLHIYTHTDSHSLYSHTTVRPVYSVASQLTVCQSLSLSLSHTDRNKLGSWVGQWLRPVCLIVTTWMLFFLVAVVHEAQSGHLAAKGNCGKVGPPVKRVRCFSSVLWGKRLCTDKERNIGSPFNFDREKHSVSF